MKESQTYKGIWYLPGQSKKTAEGILYIIIKAKKLKWN
jgi:hypothetical protein